MDYNAECCQARGTYELNCKDSHGDGWHGAYIQIGEADEHLCRNFTHGHSLNLRVEHKAPGNLESSRVISAYLRAFLFVCSRHEQYYWVRYWYWVIVGCFKNIAIGIVKTQGQALEDV